MASGTSCVLQKLNRISFYLTSFQADPIQNERERNYLRGFVASQNTEAVNPHAKVHNTSAEYYGATNDSEIKDLSTYRGRITSFGKNGWALSPSELRVYDCIKNGWYYTGSLMLRCSCCKEVLSVRLPHDVTSEGYRRAVSLLQERIVSRHTATCRYKNPPPYDLLSQPPLILSPPQLYPLGGAARVLSDELGAAVLPHLGSSEVDLMEKMDLSDSLLEEILDVRCDGVRTTAMILTLTGWKKGTCRNLLRCELCQRTVNLSIFKTIEDSLAEARGEEATASDLDKTSDTGNHQSDGASANEESNPSEASNGREITGGELSENMKRKREEEEGGEISCETKRKREEIGGDEITCETKRTENMKRKREEVEGDEITCETKRSKVSASAADANRQTKAVFNPLSQHFYWCGWVASPGAHSPPGYLLMAQQLKKTLQLSQTANWTKFPKYSTNVEGLRNVRALLSSWTK